jgi:hypothetical protein
MGRCDQGIKFCSKIQSAQNRFKPDESVGLIVANPTQLVSSQTDVGSERYCNLFIRSNRQKKNFDADCTVRTVRTGDVAGSYGRTGGDMADSWSNGKSTCGISLVNGKVPRGPIMGCHVAPLLLVHDRYVKLLESTGFDPWTSHTA